MGFFIFQDENDCAEILKQYINDPFFLLKTDEPF